MQTSRLPGTRKLQSLKSQRDESIDKLAKLDQEIHGGWSSTRVPEQIDGCNFVESGGSGSKAERGVALGDPVQQEDGKRLRLLLGGVPNVGAE